MAIQNQNRTANGFTPWKGFGTIALAAFAGYRLSQDSPVTGALLGAVVGYGAARVFNLVGKPQQKILEATEAEEDEF